MADVNIIQRGDLQQRLIKGLEIVGERSPVSTLSPEIMATVLLEDLTKQNIGRGPVGRVAAGTGIAGPTAAEFSTFQLANDNDSGVVMVIEQLSLSVATSHEVHVISANAGTGIVGLLSSLFLDPRNTGSPNGIFTFGTRPAISGLTPWWRGRVASYVDSWPAGLPVKPVLVAGDILIVQSLTVNLTLTCSITWAEYDALR